MIRALSFSIALLFGATATAAPPTPQAYMPAEAGAVFVWKNPRATLDQLESLAAQAGSAPPGAEPGWMRAMLTAENPAMAEVDLTQPLWVAVMPQPEAETEPKLILVASVKGKAEQLTATLSEKMNVTRAGALLIAVDQRLPKAFAKPQAKRFQFPKHMATLRQRSHVAGHLRLDAYPELRNALSDSDENLSQVPPTVRPLFAAMQSMQRDQWDELESISLGTGLSAASVEILAQTHPKAGTKLAAQGKAQTNSKEPLVRGLPGENYMLIGAMQSPPGAMQSRMNEALASTLASATGLDPEVRAQVEKLEAVTKGSGDCTNHAFGVLSQGALETLQMVGAVQCASTKKAMATLRGVAGWLTELAADIEKRHGEDGTPPVRARHAASKQKVGTARFDELRVDLGGDAAAEEGAALMQRPFLFGPVSAHTVAVAWNVETPQLSRLVTAAEASKPLSQPASLNAARSGLLAPRHAEVFVFAGPVVSAFAPADMSSIMGPLRVMMAQIPPVSMAIQSQADGSQLYQLVLPQQLAQLAAAMAQMRQ